MTMFPNPWLARVKAWARANGRDVDDYAERFTERAAIMEFCGGIRRVEAEKLAAEDVMR